MCFLYGARGSAVGWGTALQAAGSIPDGVIEVFHWHTMALELNQPLNEMSTRNIFWRVGLKAAGA